MSNNLDDLDYRGDNIHIQPSPNEFSLNALLPGNSAMTARLFQRCYSYRHLFDSENALQL